MANDLFHRFLEQRQEVEEKQAKGDWRIAADILRRSCFPKQRLFVEDQAQYVAALVPRGCGKTTASRARLLLRMLSEPKAHCVFVTISRTLAEQLVWIPLKNTTEKLGLGGIYNESKLEYRMANGSRLRLLGADDKKEINKLRGQSFSEVILDEVAFFSPSLLDELITQAIQPRLGVRGRLVLIGTPSPAQEGYFYEVTRPGSPLTRSEANPDARWSVHGWNYLDGSPYVPYIAEAWEAAQENKKHNGWSDEHPIWRREYLAQWAMDSSERIYKYRPHNEAGEQWNEWDPPKKGGFAQLDPKHEWNYVFGMDMGHSDPFALQVFAFSFTDPTKTLYHVYEFQKRGMSIRDIATLLLGEARDTDNPGGVIGAVGWPVGIVADTTHLGGMVLDELSSVYGIHAEKAEQKNKHDAIELCNGDFIDGRIKILKGSGLATQLSHLQWVVDPETGFLKEKKGDANDLADAMVYARRKAFHLFGEEAPQPKKRDPEALKQREIEEYVDPGEFSDWVGNDDFTSVLG